MTSFSLALALSIALLLHGAAAGSCAINPPSNKATTWTVQNVNLPAGHPNLGQVRTLPRPVETGDYCLGDNPSTFCDPGQNGFGTCVSKDVKIAQAQFVSGPNSCEIGKSVTLTFAVQWISTSFERYDVSVYIAMDGGNAMTGSCYGAILHRPAGTANSWPNDRCAGDVCNDGATIGSGLQPSSQNGPYLEVSTPLDDCHDLRQGQVTWQTLDDVPFICRDADADGQADISACLGWLNNKNEASCNGIDLAIVKAGSKCNCDTTINIAGVTVCSAQQTLCYGTDTGTLPNLGNCEPTFSARFKVSTGPVATYLPASSTLYGSIYLDFQDTNQRMALQYFNPEAAGTINTDAKLMTIEQAATAGTTVDQVIREDILWPCKSLQKVRCGSGCSTLFTSNWIPRFFVEGPAYTVNTAIGKITPDTTVACPTLPDAIINVVGLGDVPTNCVKKFNIPNSPSTAVDILWYNPTDAAQNNRVGVEVALQRDGTIWQFIKTAESSATSGGGCTVRDPYVRGVTLSPKPSASTRQGAFDLPCAGTFYNWAKFDTLTGCSSTQPLCSSDTEVAFVIDAQSSIPLTEWRTYWLPYVWRTVAGFDPANTQTQFGFCFSSGETSTTPVCQVDGSLISDRPSICQTYLKVGTNTIPCGSTSTRGKAGGSTDFRAMINTALSTYFATAASKPRRLVVLVGGLDAPVNAPTWDSVWDTANAAGVQIHAVGIGSGSFDTDLLKNIVGSTGGTYAQWSDSLLLAGDSYLYRRLCPGATPVCDCDGFCECANGDALCPASCTQTTNCGQSSCSPTNPCAGCVLAAGATKQCPDLCYSCNELDDGKCNILKECPEPDSGKDTKCTDWACATINGVAKCVGTAKPASFCNDGNGCTVDSCVPGSGCVYSDRSTQICNDNDECTDDFCINNAGVAACQYSPINVESVCSDKNVCTKDSCVTGSFCVHDPIPCDDGNPCTVSVCDPFSGCSHQQKNCDDSNPCTTDSCDGNGNCVNTLIDSCQCVAACDGLMAADKCQSLTCVQTVGECTLTGGKTWIAPATEAECQASFPAPGVFCGVVDLSASICTTPDDLCYKYTCHGATGTCTRTSTDENTNCPDADLCTKDYCDGVKGCQHDPLVTCTPPNECALSSCDTTTGRCATSTVESGLCKGCASLDATSPASLKRCVTGANLCNPVACVDNCANAPAAQAGACAAALTADGFYCATFPVQCLASTTCTTYSCDSSTGKCVSSRSAAAAVCDDKSTGCSPQKCVDGVGCVTQTASDPCTNAELPNKCAASKCQIEPITTTFPNGYSCVEDVGARDCSDYSCSADAKAPEPAYTEYVITAAAAAQFQIDYSGRNPKCDALACTADTCDTTKGCVNSVLACSVPEGTCNVTLGCFEANNKFNFAPGVCQLQVDQSLVDFCGVCFGDYASCFFQTVVPVSTVAGIAGGVVAGIVIAAVIAALLIFWLTKKGYDYYQMQSQLNAVGLQENPTFQANNHATGVIPD